MIARRSAIARTAIEVVTPLALVLAVYLLFAGHNRPGGGFAAGLVVGAIAALRAVSGLTRPRYAGTLLAVGVLVAALEAVAPLFGGDVLLDQVVVEDDVPLLGKVKSGSALIFDIGVMLVVVGLVNAVLDAFDAFELEGRRPGDPQ